MAVPFYILLISNNEKFYSSDHSYPLVDGLTPSIRFSIVQNKYMGKPYTRKSPSCLVKLLEI